MIRPLILELVLAAWLPFVASAAGEAPLLHKHAPVAREIAAGEIHGYRIKLDRDQYLMLSVDQRDIDVLVRVYDPFGKKALEVDNLGATGREIVTFFSESRGVHRIEIAPFADDAEGGSYEVRVDRLEKAGRAGSGRVAQLMAPLDRPDSPGAAVAVMRGGEVIYQGGFGSAQLEYGIVISPQTVFHVASVSKQFTAFAVALLADRGKLSLDDDVRKHIPELPDFGKTITLRHLIHHTSGLRDQWNLLALAGWRLDDVITRDHIMTLVRNQQELNFDPGAEYLYCNTGYTLLAETVARVTGKPFPEWTAEQIFRPLGMTQTHFHDDHQRIVTNRAYSYAKVGTGYRKSVLNYANVGATSLFTTVGDLARWSRNFDTAKVGGEAVVGQMLERGVLDDGSELDYAFGLVHGEHRGLPTIGHSGGDAGFRSHLVRYPDHDLTVVVLSNLGGLSPGAIARRIAELYLKDEMLAAESADASDQESIAGDAAVEPGAQQLAELEGDYQFASGLVVTVSRDGARLTVQARGQQQVELRPMSGLHFAAHEIDAIVEFNRGAAGDIGGLTLLQAGQQNQAERVEPIATTSEQLADYAGRYYSPELGTFYLVEVDAGALVARHRRHGEIGLAPTGRDAFTGDRWFFSTVAFERDAEGAVTTMRVSSGRVRNLRFARQAD